MVIVLLIVAGLALGSFVNALVWRLHKQSLVSGRQSSAKNRNYSIVHGRSMCTHCGHALAWYDLVPVLSWLWLRGKCRYCGKPIEDNPLVEIAVPALFVLSYLLWPLEFNDKGLFTFVLWLGFMVGFVALAAYDLKWFLLPDKIVFPLMSLAVVQVAALTFLTKHAYIYGPVWSELLGAVVGALALSGLFYALYKASDKQWIGFGDVKLAIVLGFLAGGLFEIILLLFAASVMGMLVALPLLLSGKATRKSHIPFGPFLLAGMVVVQLFGADIIDWYTSLLIF